MVKFVVGIDSSYNQLNIFKGVSMSECGGGGGDIGGNLEHKLSFLIYLI